MTFISLRPQPAALQATTPVRDDTLNRVLHPLDDPEWPAVIAHTGLDRAECWGRKFAAATFQYAHLMKCVLMHFPQGVNGLTVLMPGGYEDPIAETLHRMGALVAVADPEMTGVTLRDFASQGENAGLCDLVLAASVLEHTRDDAEFLADIALCLKPGGYAFLTCDFKEGWRPGDALAPTEERLYTRESLMALTDTLGDGVEWCGERDWQSRGDYFCYGGIDYGFASIAFRKLLSPGTANGVKRGAA